MSQPDLASFLLLPPTTRLYDSLPEMTITKVDFSMATKSLQLKGVCENRDGKRFYLKTILQAKDDMHVTTLLYEKEDQVMASGKWQVASAVFLSSSEESMDRLLAVEDANRRLGLDMQCLEKGPQLRNFLQALDMDGDSSSDDSLDDFTVDFTSGSAAFLPSLEVPGDCILDSGEDCLCNRCLNDLTFDDGEEEDADEEKDVGEKDDEEEK